MDAIEYIKGEMAGVRRLISGIMKDMPPEVFNWSSPGTCNTISATFLHLLNAEDQFVQDVLQGKPTVWESGGWSEKTGVQKPPSIGEDWSEFKHRQTKIQPIMDYMSAVFAATDTYLADLTPEDLDRTVQFAGKERTFANILQLSVSQSHNHLGEIAALKGCQGLKGLPV